MTDNQKWLLIASANPEGGTGIARVDDKEADKYWRLDFIDCVTSEGKWDEYRITDEGREHLFIQLLADMGEPDDS